ncbi:hypothetical protein BZA05DRAFT_475582 [Tricharina praecox]|uniref:uncharacterized protein n=1 Tax=Tricharina praecox TaxID=43433 RepID=UPI002220EC88|nr:uncharacterized protein BZA05DRAFT_475582 [Tricharina praecox]KAI5848121.1 hypothetical protein BZA05DRAFT_475582 [Tricharina praecox]
MAAALTGHGRRLLLRHLHRANHLRPTSEFTLTLTSAIFLRHSTGSASTSGSPVSPVSPAPAKPRTAGLLAASDHRISCLSIPEGQAGGDLRFPLAGAHDFRALRAESLTFFDKTRYIPLLTPSPAAEKEPGKESGKEPEKGAEEPEKGARVKLLCRPDNFGKSLTKSMMAAFHAVEHKPQFDEVFGGLDVAAAVKKGEVENGRYLVLELDFERAGRGVEATAERFGEYVNGEIKAFVERYRRWGMKLEVEGCDFENHGKIADNLKEVVRQVCRELEAVKAGKNEESPLYNVRGIFVMIDDFDAPARDILLTESKETWAAAKPNLASAYTSLFQAIAAGMQPNGDGISQVYMTGLAPLLLSHEAFSTFDDVGITNLSFNHRFFGLCGLTGGDVNHALCVINKENDSAQRLFSQLKFRANNYHFTMEKKVLKTYNTLTITKYLTAVAQKATEDTEPTAPDTSSPYLSPLIQHVCSIEPAVFEELKAALILWQIKKRVRYSESHFPSLITPGDLLSTDEKGVHAWRLLLLYQGVFRYDSQYPRKFLALGNGARFGDELRARFGEDVGKPRDETGFVKTIGMAAEKKRSRWEKRVAARAAAAEAGVGNDGAKVGKDEASGSKDEVTGSKDEASGSKDEVTGSKDEASGSKDEASVITDEITVSKDEASISTDEVTISTDEPGVTSATKDN